MLLFVVAVLVAFSFSFHPQLLNILLQNIDATEHGFRGFAVIAGGVLVRNEKMMEILLVANSRESYEKSLREAEVTHHHRRHRDDVEFSEATQGDYFVFHLCYY